MNSRVGRNDPCPCGSGKKYKKCCWEKDQPKKGFSASKAGGGLGSQGAGILNMISNIPFPSAEPKDVPPPKEKEEKSEAENENS